MKSWGCFRSWLILVFVSYLAKSEEIQSKQSLSSCELEKLLRPLVSPNEAQTIQVQALRQQLSRLLEQHLHDQVDNNVDKRSLESLARGGYIRNVNYADDNSQSGKRSIQSLMRTGQLPIYLQGSGKRSIESLARNGELIVPNKSEEQNQEVPPLKKSMGSIDRDFNFPIYGKRFSSEIYERNPGSREEVNENFKRNLASVARSGLLSGKRDGYYFPEDNQSDEGFYGKRNIGSIMAHYPYRFKRSVDDGSNNADDADKSATRRKRLADYLDDSEQQFFNKYDDDNVVDYEELMQELNEIYPIEGKRFLGSIVRHNWPSSLTRYRSPDKRHIGSLARLGWLPAFRNVRRFNRSGRSATDGECPPCQRKTSSNGKTEDYYFSENAIPSLNDKRFLLIPAVDNILLRRYSTRRPQTQ